MRKYIAMILCLSSLLLVVTSWGLAATLPTEAVYGFSCMTTAGEGALSSYICNSAHLSASTKTQLGVWYAGDTAQLAFIQPNQNGIAGGLYVTRWEKKRYEAAYVVALGQWKGMSTSLTLRSAFDLSGPNAITGWASDLGLQYSKSIFSIYGVYSSPYTKAIPGNYQPKLRYGLTIGGNNVAVALDGMTYQHGEKRYAIGGKLHFMGVTLKASGISAAYQSGMSLEELFDTLSPVFAANIDVGSLQIGATYQPQTTDEPQRWSGSLGWMW